MFELQGSILTILPLNGISGLFLLPSSTTQHPHQQYLMVPQEIRMPVLELRQGQPELGKMPIAGLLMLAHRHRSIGGLHSYSTKTRTFEMVGVLLLASSINVQILGTVDWFHNRAQNIDQAFGPMSSACPPECTRKEAAQQPTSSQKHPDRSQAVKCIPEEASAKTHIHIDHPDTTDAGKASP